MKSEVNIHVGNIDNDKARCGYCLVGLFDEEIWVCDVCDTALHRECHDELQSCVTIGCTNKQPSTLSTGVLVTATPRGNIIFRFLGLLTLSILLLTFLPIFIGCLATLAILISEVFVAGSGLGQLGEIVGVAVFGLISGLLLWELMKIVWRALRGFFNS